jgi:transcriptional regulator with XRE-family HTH domain
VPKKRREREIMTNPRTPDQVDVQVGQRIRIQRLANRMSQMALANALGVTLQQVQRYEKGVSRVGAGRLTTIATALGVPVIDLLESHNGARHRRESQDAAASLLHVLNDQGALKLLRAYGGLPDGMRRLVVRLVEQIAAG